MATYRSIVGHKINNVSSDPAEPLTGQMWYNSTTGTLRALGVVEAWSSTSPMINSVQYRGGGGTPTAMFAAGGSLSTNLTEEYNGSGWSAGGNIGTARYEMGSAGTLTAGLIFGGYNNPPASTKDLTEEYDGSSWTAGGALNTARYSQGGFGIQTAAVYSSGFNPSSLQTDTEEYNGTSWSEGNNPAQARYDVGTGGTLTAGIIFGGGGATAPVVYANTELYDGTNWTAGPAMNTARSTLGGSGTQTAAIGFGGRSTPVVAITEQFDGTSWTEVGDLATARRNITANRSNTGNSEAIAAGGSPGSGTVTLVEQWNISTNTITAAAWASGGALGTARYQIGGAGDLPAGLAYGGYGTSVPGNTNKTEEYNGTSWSEQNDMSNPRGQCSGQHIGTQTAALAAGGTLPGSPNYGSACEEYDGTSWTAGGALTEDSGRSYVAGFGTQTAGVAGGGYAQTGATANSEEYDGSSWTAGNNMNTGRYGASGTGTQTAGLAVGQYPGTGTVEEYDGTNWTSVTTYPAGRFGIYGGMGTQTDSIHAGGSASTTRTTETFGYDGTTWSTRPSLANALSSGASGGTSTSAFIAGGRGSPPGPTAGVTTTEEFTGETSAANITDFTTS